MRIRAKALTVAVAMVTTFAILPTFGAAAAEPLEDGSYDVVVGASSYTVEVVEGAPVVGEVEGVEFLFAFDEETGRVLDEFDVSINGTSYDVAVAEDGTVTVTDAVEEGTDGESEADEPVDGEESGEGDESGEGVEPTEGEEESTEGEQDDEELEGLEEQGDDEGDEEPDEAEDAAHGQRVSTVAQCAPKGRQAREAGLPNHGFFVRAAAHGEDVEFEVDGETVTAALSSQEGADAFCAIAEGLVGAEGAPTDETDASAEAPEVDAAETEDDEKDEASGRRDKGSDKAADRGKGRANAPGQQKKNG